MNHLPAGPTAAPMSRRRSARVPVWGVAAFALAARIVLAAAPEAFQAGPDRVVDLPGGKEADGIIGDFVLRNDQIEAVIGSGRPQRKPNLFVPSDGKGAPGSLYDLTLRGQHNDQLTIFSPGNLRGEVSHVRVLKDGREGEASVEVLVSAALHQGLQVRHEYRLREGWSGLLIVTTVRNEAAQKAKYDPEDHWAPVTRLQTVRGYAVNDAVDPADKCGYAYRWIDIEGFTPPPEDLELDPGAERTFARGLAVGASPAAAFGALAARLEGTSMLRGTLHDDQGRAISTATVAIAVDDKTLLAYPDARGRFDFPLPFGEYAARVTDLGRAPVERALSIQPDKETRLDLTLGPASQLNFDIRGENGASLPCKVQILGTNGTASPDLGPANRAHGCRDQYHSERGKFTVAVPPGKYHVVVTHGIEFGHLAQSIDLAAGATVEIHGNLRRLLDSRGWISADFHSHSTPSGDNTTGTDDRLINLAAEHIEFAPATEHNRIYDWAPHLARLGLTNEIATIPGLELTGGGPHLNAFPFQPIPHTQNGGGPDWFRDPRLDALLLRDFQGRDPARWVQINHPDMIENWVDRDGDGRADGGYVGLTPLVDGAEVWGTGILTNTPYLLYRAPNGKDTIGAQREFVWLQLLNQGHRLTCVAVSDAHGIYGNGVGGWRTYVRSSKDRPADLAWSELSRNAKAGRTFVTTGPFLEVTTEDGTGPGGTTRANAGVHLHVKVQCTDWVRIDRVQVLVNGRPAPKLNFTRAQHPQAFKDGVVQFERDLGVPLSEDAHLIVVAVGEQADLKVGYGTSEQAKLRPIAYHNPIFVDVDGNGWRPNGDTLGWELPVRRVDPEEVRALIEAHQSRDTPPEK